MNLSEKKSEVENGIGNLWENFDEVVLRKRRRRV